MGTADRNEAIAIVGRHLFGNDWIGNLTAKELKLLQEHGPQIRDASTTNVAFGPIERCPAALAKRLDVALGRFLRLRAQQNAADKWLIEHGPPFNFGSCDRAALNTALKKIDGLRRHIEFYGPGRRATLGPHIERKMRDALKNGLDPSELAQMKIKDLAEKYRCGSTLAREIRQRVLGDYNSREFA